MELPSERQRAAIAALKTAIVGAAILAVAGCGQGSKSNKADHAPPPGGAPAQSANGPAAPIPATPVVDPARDTRPDRAKFDDFTGHLQAQQDAWLAADSQLIGTVRGGLQKGSQAEARAALVAYANTIQAELAGLPPPPILSGCFSRAAGLDTARTAAASALTARRDQTQALLAISYRPLNLADFGPLASQTSGTQQQAQGITATLAAARAAVTDCDAPGKTPPSAMGGRHVRSPRRHGAFGHYGPAADAGVDPPLPPPPDPSRRSTPLTPSERAARAPEQSAAPPPKKSKNLLDRLTHPF